MRFEAIYLDNTIDKYVEEIAAELQKSNPNREKILSLADALDAQSKTEGKARYNAVLQIVEKAYGVNAADYNMAHVRSTAKTLASSIFVLTGLGLNYDTIKGIVGGLPNIVSLSEEYIEERRKYFGFTREEFAEVVERFPRVVSYSEEHIEARREYFGYTKEEFAKIVGKFPDIIGYSEERIEARRKYFGFTREKFAKIVSKSINVISNSEEHIEARREYFGYTKEEFAKIVGKFPKIISYSEENIEARRGYFGYTKEEFAKIVSKSINVISNSEEHIEARRKYFGFTREEFAEVVERFPSILGYSEEYIEERRKYLGLDMKTFSGLVYRLPPILSLGEENLERRFDWCERHFSIGKDELMARLVEKPVLYGSLFSSSFYTRVLLRTKAMTANGKTLNDVRDLASVLKFNEKDFVEKHGNGISVDDYIRLKDLARVTDEANPKKQKSKA